MRRSRRSAYTLCTALLVVAGCAHIGRGRAPGPSTLRIYLARHGQTDWNAQRRLQGWSNRHLDDTGRQQAAKLAERLRGVRLDRVYSSTLNRSHETAEIAHGDAPLESLDGLREQRLGKFEGLHLAPPDSAGAAEFARRSRNADDALDGGESPNQLFLRVRSTVQQIVTRHPAGAILIVGHGGTNRMILRELLGLRATQADSIRQANDELYLIEIQPGAPPQLWKAIGARNLGDL